MSMIPDRVPLNLSHDSGIYKGGSQTETQRKAAEAAQAAASVPLATEFTKSISLVESVALQEAFDKNDLQSNVDPGSRGEKERVRDAKNALSRVE
jgi:predicted secreted protein